jgi:hypothetical protein
MQEVTYEQVLSQVKALPPEDAAKLRAYLNAQEQQDKLIEAARAQAHAASLRDLSAEQEWIETHRDEYAGQWVALKEGQLLSHGTHGKDVHAAAAAAGHPDALLVLVQPKDERPFVNI